MFLINRKCKERSIIQKVNFVSMYSVYHILAMPLRAFKELLDYDVFKESNDTIEFTWVEGGKSRFMSSHSTLVL